MECSGEITKTDRNKTFYHREYWNDEVLSKEGMIVDWDRDGYWIFYDIEGEIRETGCYCGGERIGCWKDYTDFGVFFTYWIDDNYTTHNEDGWCYIWNRSALK
jgi:hypothetical protein